jgi:hypothetical protein
LSDPLLQLHPTQAALIWSSTTMRCLSHFGLPDALTQTQCHCLTQELHRFRPLPSNRSMHLTPARRSIASLSCSKINTCRYASLILLRLPAYGHQVASALPYGTNIYGLGEVIASSGFRRDIGTDGGVGTIQTHWNRDVADPIDQNM